MVKPKEYLRVPTDSTFDLDAGAAATDNAADVKWNASGKKSLAPVNGAQAYLCRPSDRTSIPR